VLTFASSRIGTMALMGSLIFSPSASVPIARSCKKHTLLVLFLVTAWTDGSSYKVHDPLMPGYEAWLGEVVNKFSCNVL
jgi:hypothetical protein